MNTCELCGKTITQEDVKAGELQIVDGFCTVHRRCNTSEDLRTIPKKVLWLAQSQLSNYKFGR